MTCIRMQGNYENEMSLKKNLFGMIFYLGEENGVFRVFTEVFRWFLRFLEFLRSASSLRGVTLRQRCVPLCCFLFVEELKTYSPQVMLLFRKKRHTMKI